MSACFWFQSSNVERKNTDYEMNVIISLFIISLYSHSFQLIWISGYIRV